MKRRTFISRLVASFGLLVAAYGTFASRVGCIVHPVIRYEVWISEQAGDAGSLVNFLESSSKVWTPHVKPSDQTHRLLYTHIAWGPSDFYADWYEQQVRKGQSKFQRNSDWQVDFPELTDADKRYMHHGLLRARITDRRSKGGLTKLPLP